MKLLMGEMEGVNANGRIGLKTGPLRANFG